MTPRALLTAIGATAIAFAIALGATVESVTSQTAPVLASTQTAATTQPEVALHTLAAHESCPVAL